MSTSKRGNTLWKIREAVMKNTCRPLPKETEDIDSKAIRVSALREGDSQVGLMLFIGIATKCGHSAGDISLAEGIEHSEIAYKLEKYKEKIKTDKRFFFKNILVLNYLRLVA